MLPNSKVKNAVALYEYFTSAIELADVFFCNLRF